MKIVSFNLYIGAHYFNEKEMMKEGKRNTGGSDQVNISTPNITAHDHHKRETRQTDRSSSGRIKTTAPTLFIIGFALLFWDWSRD
jgi:hypothetical protein